MKRPPAGNVDVGLQSTTPTLSVREAKKHTGSVRAAIAERGDQWISGTWDGIAVVLRNKIKEETMEHFFGLHKGHLTVTADKIAKILEGAGYIIRLRTAA